MAEAEVTRIQCVGAIMRDDAGRMLLIRRGHEPAAGLWSIPGGRVEAGETDHEALVREIREETGLVIQPGRLIGSVQRPAGDGRIFEIRDYVATVTGGTLVPGDDAADARWVTSLAEVASADGVTDGLDEALADWGVA